jgi:hypothetical protein
MSTNEFYSCHPTDCRWRDLIFSSGSALPHTSLMLDSFYIDCRCLYFSSISIHSLISKSSYFLISSIWFFKSVMSWLFTISSMFSKDTKLEVFKCFKISTNILKLHSGLSKVEYSTNAQRESAAPCCFFSMCFSISERTYESRLGDSH